MTFSIAGSFGRIGERSGRHGTAPRRPYRETLGDRGPCAASAMRPEKSSRPADMPADRPTQPADRLILVRGGSLRPGAGYRDAAWNACGPPGHRRRRADERAGPANVNPVAAPASTPVAVLGRRPAHTAWPAGTWAWFVALLSLVLAGNLVTCRYLFWDAFYDLYAGRYIVQHGIPHQNLITVASYREAWQDQQWLAHVIFYATWDAGGYRLLAGLSAILVTAGYGLLALIMLRRGVPPIRAFAWTAAAYMVAIGSVGIRAQSFAYPCLA